MGDEKSKHGTRLPEPFPISESMLAWFEKKIGVVPREILEEEHEVFMDYWRSSTGQIASKADWPATWRNWMRRAARWRISVLGSWFYAHRYDADEKLAMTIRPRYERLN